MSDDPNRIRELRLARTLSQQALADLAGCSKMTISDLERGRMELTLTWMRRLAPLLDVNVADLLPASLNDGALNPDERRYLSRYREADAEQRKTLDRISAAVVPDQEGKAA